MFNYPRKKSVALRWMVPSSYWPPFQKKFNKHYTNRPTENERHKAKTKKNAIYFVSPIGHLFMITEIQG